VRLRRWGGVRRAVVNPGRDDERPLLVVGHGSLELVGFRSLDVFGWRFSMEGGEGELLRE
jgi:hypothetical protein